MFREVLILVSSAVAGYAWLCAIVSPVARSIHSWWSGVRSGAWLPGLLLGNIGWSVQAISTDRLPRIEEDFEVATDHAACTGWRPDPAAAGNTISNTAPPAGPFDAWISPPCRTTIARTMESPRPLRDGMCVPDRDASAL
jgi:hypothetical protein